MGYFPFFMELEGREGLIVGGGAIAWHKVKKLLPFGAKLTVVAPEITKELLETDGITCLQRAFQDEDLKEKMFVIAASDQKEINGQVSSLCRQQGIPVNVVDNKEACSFLFPALVKDGSLTVGISTGGASPAAASYIRKWLEAKLPENMDEILESLLEFRNLAKERIPDQKQREEVLKSAALFCMDGQRALPPEEAERLMAPYL